MQICGGPWGGAALLLYYNNHAKMSFRLRAYPDRASLRQHARTNQSLPEARAVLLHPPSLLSYKKSNGINPQLVSTVDI